MTHRFITLFVLLGVAFCGARAQLSVVFVDALYGSDSFSGSNPADVPPGSGPKATIHAGLESLADRGRLVIFAGAYAGDGVDTDGSVAVGTDDGAINISIAKYPRLVSGLTIELRSSGGNNEIKISADANTVLAPNGALITHTADQYIPNFILDIPGGLLTITSTNGTEFLSLAGRHSLGSPVAGLFLERGTVDIARSSSFRLSNGSTISLRGSSRFARQAPQKENDLNVSYLGDESFTAGAESAYPSFGTGLLIVAKSAGTTVTFPSPMAFSGNNDAIQIRSGNAIFNGSITLGAAGNQTSSPRTADIVIASNGIVTFAAPLSLFVAGGTVADSSISSIINSGAGTVTFQKRIAWYGATNSSDATFLASDSTALAVNSGSGSLTFSSGILLSHTPASGESAATVEVAVLNSGRGRLSFGMPVDVVSHTVNGGVGIQRFSLAAVNNGGGTLEVSGTIRSRLVNAAAGLLVGTVNITGATSLGSLGASNGVLTNAQDGVINLGPNNLTLYGSVSHSLAGSYVTSTSGAVIVAAEGSVGIDGGSLPILTVAQPSGGSTAITKAASLSALVVLSGECRMQSPLSVTGTIDVSGGALVLEDGPGRILLAGTFRQTGGTARVGGNSGGDLKVLGDFRRTGGSFVHGSGSSLIFAGGSSQAFHGGPSLQLSSLTVENTGGFVTVAEPVRVAGNLSFARGTRVELGSSTIVLNGGAGIFTNDGSFNATGPGIVLGGAHSIPGGSSLIGAEIRAGSQASFSSFTIDVGAGNTCALKATAPVKWSGSLSLLSGSLDLASPHDLSPGSTQAGLVIDVARSNGINRSVGSFNTSKVHYTLRLIGNLQRSYTLSPELTSDLTSVDTLIVDVNSDTEDTDSDPRTGSQQFFQFPGGLFVFGGSLQVGPVAVVRLEGDGKSGNSMELSGPSASHRIRGILTTADSGDAIVVSGERATMIGGDGDRDVALVGSIVIRSETLCRISSIRGFLGTFTTSPGSSAALSMGQSSDDRKIAGGLVLNGNSFVLEGELEVQGGVQFNSGVLAFGQNDLILTTKGDFSQAQGAGGYSTTGGSLVMSCPGARLRIGNSDAAGLPNLHVMADTYLASAGRVMQTILIGNLESNGIPTLHLGQTGNDLFFSGSTITLLSNGSGNRNAVVADGTSNGTPGGRLYVTGTSVTLVMNNDFAIEELVYNPPALSGTLTILSTDLTPRTLTISDMMTHAGGQIGLGFNHLSFTGTGLQPGLRSYNRSDGTIGASSGEFRFAGKAPQQFSCGSGFSVANLRIANPFSVAKNAGSDPIIVTKSLDLSNGVLTFDPGTIIIESGATLIRRKSSATLSSSLSFRASANVSYLIDPANGILRTGPELPTDPGVLSSLRVFNPHTAPDSAFVILTHDVKVNQSLYLEAGVLDLGGSKLTLANGGTIDLSGGRIHVPSDASGGIILSTYNLICRRSVALSSSSLEFPAGPGISLSRLSILGSSDGEPTIVGLYANRTVGTLYVNAPKGGVEFGAPGSFVARNLTVRDTLRIIEGGFTNTSGTNAILNLAGNARQVVSLPPAGLTLPGGASAVHLLLNNRAGCLLTGGDLKFSAGAIILFVNGVLDAGEQAVVLSRTVASQGFDRQNVSGSDVSHVVGRVRQSITGGAGSADVYPNGRYEFPTGSPTDYRPLAITFTNAYPARNPGELEVSHVNQLPAGVAGLPLEGGPGSFIGSKSPFFWKIIGSQGGFAPDQKFDLETTVENPGVKVQAAANARFILREDASPDLSRWNMLAPSTGYGTNSLTVDSDGDTLLTVRVLATTGLRERSVLTVGLPIERKPYLNSRNPESVSLVTFNAPVTFVVSVSDPDRLPVTITWKVNGSIVKSGRDTSLTYSFQAPLGAQWVRAIFSNSLGFADSTEWRFLVVSVPEGVVASSREFQLHQNYPNPFNPATTISFDLPSACLVSFKIYDLLGVEIATLASGMFQSGTHAVTWSPRGLPSGIYFCRLSAINMGSGGDRAFTASRQLILAK